MEGMLDRPAGSRALRVLVTDDHPIFRSGIRQILTEAADVAHVGEAADPQQAIALARTEAWDIVILDIGLPGRGGLDVLKEMKQERPRVPVLVLSMHSEEQYAVRALKAGASGYLTKEAAPERLIEAIDRILGGGLYISPTVAEQLVVAVARDSSKPLHATLSDREFEVMRLIASGKTVGEIADLLSLSVKTVSGYRGRVLDKTGLANNAEIMKYALQHGLVDHD